MKKTIILIICFLSIYTTSNAFFGSPTSLDLYKNIDKGIDDLEDKMLTFELNGGVKETTIIEEINKLATIEEINVCLDESKYLSQNKFEQIIKGNLINELSELFIFDCYGNIELITKYLELFKKYQINSRNLAIKKTDQIYKISNIGLYSDGILENSGFDLITDIEDIDKIIFASEIYYEGEEDVDLGGTINSALDSIDQKMNDLMYPNRKKSLDSKETAISQIIYEPKNNNQTDDNTLLMNNNYICSDNNIDSGLSQDSLIFLDNQLQNSLNKDNIIIQNNINPNLDISGNKQNNIDNGANIEIAGNYNKVRDNSEWPCESFFCITIDFIMYQHSLFGGGENITIEYLLNRSNEHLKKISATSLVPAKMTTNNFEIGLKDLNLPDIFHLGFQVSTKPVPILNIEDKSKRDETEFAAKNMLEEYYEANGLDYKRRNDLVLLKNTEQEKQIILNSENLTIKNALEKQKEYFEVKYNITEFNKYSKEKKKVNLINKSIEKKVSYGVLQTFEEQYTELDKFTITINDYVKNLQSIIGAMNTIPIDNG